METHALGQFRRRFLSAAAQEKMDASLADHQAVIGLLDPATVRKNDRVLVLGAASPETLRGAARLAGPEGTVLAVVDSPSLLLQIRQQLIGEENHGGTPGVRAACAGCTDLRSDLEWIDGLLRQHPVKDATGLSRLREQLSLQASQSPLVGDLTIDIVLSETLVNQLSSEQMLRASSEILRVLRKGGRAIFSCLLCDEPLPAQALASLAAHKHPVRRVPTEEEFLSGLERAGFYGVEVIHWPEFPQHLVQGIEIRQVGVQAFHGKEGPCYDRNHAVIYRGPWKSIRDDDGHTYRRGERVAVCEKTFRILTSEPYRSHFIPVPPYVEVPVEAAIPFACRGTAKRDPRETKGSLSPQKCQADQKTNGSCC